MKAFSWDLRPDSDRTPPHQSTLQRCSDRPGGSHCELSPHCLVGVDNWNPANSKFHDRRQVPSPFLASASVGARLWVCRRFPGPAAGQSNTARFKAEILQHNFVHSDKHVPTRNKHKYCRMTSSCYPSSILSPSFASSGACKISRLIIQSVEAICNDLLRSNLPSVQTSGFFCVN